MSASNLSPDASRTMTHRLIPAFMVAGGYFSFSLRQILIDGGVEGAIQYAFMGFALCVFLTCFHRMWLPATLSEPDRRVLSAVAAGGVVLVLALLAVFAPSSWALSFSEPFGSYALKMVAVIGSCIVMVGAVSFSALRQGTEVKA